MKQYRKTQIIEVVSVGRTNHIINRYEVRNKNNPKDRWWIDAKTFQATYEPVEAADYTILTKEEREHIRDRLYNVMTSAYHAAKTPSDAADLIMAIQRHAGEDLKSFDEKNQYLKLVTHHINKFSKSRFQSIVTPDGLLIDKQE